MSGERLEATKPDQACLGTRISISACSWNKRVQENRSLRVVSQCMWFCQVPLIVKPVVLTRETDNLPGMPLRVQNFPKRDSGNDFRRSQSPYQKYEMPSIPKSKDFNLFLHLSCRPSRARWRAAGTTLPTLIPGAGVQTRKVLIFVESGATSGSSMYTVNLGSS